MTVQSAFFWPPRPQSPSKEPYFSQQPVGGTASAPLTSFLFTQPAFILGWHKSRGVAAARWRRELRSGLWTYAEGETLWGQTNQAPPHHSAPLWWGQGGPREETAESWKLHSAPPSPPSSLLMSEFTQRPDRTGPDWTRPDRTRETRDTSISMSRPPL